MTVGLQKLRVPLLERLALADMALRRGESEEECLARIIHEAVWLECARDASEVKSRPKEESVSDGEGVMP